jgi:hypothetical protein
MLDLITLPSRVRKIQSRRSEAIILFLCSPLLSLILAFRNHRASWAKNVMWLFVAFFGYTFFVSSAMDSSRYSERLAYLSRQQAGSIPEFLSLIYEKETGYVDILEPLITFTLSRFTEDSRILFAIFGFIFGYFYSRNLWFLFDYVDGKIKRESLPFLLLVAFVIAIWQVNGFRFWTAAHIFIFGLLTIHSGKLSKGVIIAISTIFVHFSFALPLLLLVFHLLVGNRLIIFFGIYFFSFFVSEINPTALQQYANNIPEVFQDRTKGYSNEEYRKKILKTYETANWYVTLRFTALHYSLNILLAILFFRNRKLISNDAILIGLFCFALLLTSTTNLVRSVHSMGRFQAVADVIMFSFLFILIQRNSFRIFPRWASLSFLAAAILYIVVEIRIGFDTVSLLTVLGNPIIAPFLPNDFPLINFFK